MTRTLIAAIFGLALCLNPLSAMPARATEAEEIARVLGLLAVLGLAGTAYNDYRDRKKDDRRDRAKRDRDRDRHKHRSRGYRRVLPEHCLRIVHTRYGSDRVFGRRCLRRAGVRVIELPRSCARDLRLGGRWRSAYDARCLRHSGWKVARHHY